jgi:hypothetical protein
MSKEPIKTSDGYAILIRKVKEMKSKYKDKEDEMAQEIVEDLERLIQAINAERQREHLSSYSNHTPNTL